MKRTTFRAFLNTRKSGKDVVKRVKSKKRKPNDINFGSRKGQGGLGFGYSLDAGISSDAGGVGENLSFEFGTMTPKAQFHDQGNTGHYNNDPRSPKSNSNQMIFRRNDASNPLVDVVPEDEEQKPNQDSMDDQKADLDFEQQKQPLQDPENVDELEPEQEDEVDPSHMGLIRYVKSAHLVYKRQTEEGTYEELWIYNIKDNVEDEIKIKQNILAGTDIEPNRTKTKDGSQHYELWTAGNAQLLYISGLPN